MILRIPYEEILEVLTTILMDNGFTEDKSRIAAGLFAEASRDGVASHGLNRFARFLRQVRAGTVDPGADLSRIWSGGALERWDGHFGAGMLNARKAMNRAMALAEEYGIGCVALSRTNHWMRGGNFGRQAAEAGYIGICWTNTLPNLPPWGSRHPLVGNNPLILAVPREGESPVVLDMAMSQFSYGALETHQREKRSLPIPGGYDNKDELTRDPSEILVSGRPLPIGFWKGSGLSLLLDLVGALLSGGQATCDIPRNPEDETDLSQVFLAFSPPDYPGLVDRVLDGLTEFGEDLRIPGDRVDGLRAECARSGVPVDQQIWKEILTERPD